MTFQLFLPGQFVIWKDGFGKLQQGRFIDIADDYIIVSIGHEIAHIHLSQVES